MTELYTSTMHTHILGQPVVLAIDGASLLYTLLTNEDWRYGGELKNLQRKTKAWLDIMEPLVDSLVVFVDVVTQPTKEAELILRQYKRLNLLRSAYDKPTCPPHSLRPAAALGVFLRVLRKSKKVGVSLLLTVPCIRILLSTPHPFIYSQVAGSNTLLIYLPACTFLANYLLTY